MPGRRVLVAFSVIALAAYGSLACTEHRTDPPTATNSSSRPPPASDRTYDRTRSETFRGSIVRVEQAVATPARGGTSEGVHLIVVTGSRVAVDGKPVLIAQKVTTPERELVLRDEDGVPRWSMGRRSETSGQTTTAPVPLQRREDMSELNTTEQQALRDALEDEYRAWSTYDQVIRDLGAERPFINIRDAEARHIAALRSLFERYGLEIPANTWAGRVPRYATMREACEASVEAEIANAALYDRLMRSTTRSDILAVFTNLRSASQDRHLQAFQRCATRGPGRRAGP